jgi:hypothetical protein
MGSKKIERLYEWGTRANDAASFIMWLITFAATSGVATTLALFWQQLPWYQALVYGAALAAALVMLVVGIDHLVRIHTINRKFAVFEVRVAHIGISPKKLTFHLVAFVGNRALRPIWYKLDRVNCHIDMTTHQPAPAMLTALEIQPDSPGQIPIPPITVNAGKHEFGRLECELKYGKSQDRLRRTYKTNGQFKISVFPDPMGLPSASVVSLGAKAEYA